MKFSTSILALSLTTCSAYVVPPLATRLQQQQLRPSFIHMSTSSTESDFASAMPAKPEQTLGERLQESATEFIVSFEERLGEGVEPPPELAALKQARDDAASPQILSTRIYELMLEQGMLYDVDPETGIMTPTEWDIKANLEEPNVKKEFYHLCKSRDDCSYGR